MSMPFAHWDTGKVHGRRAVPGGEDPPQQPAPREQPGGEGFTWYVLIPIRCKDHRQLGDLECRHARGRLPSRINGSRYHYMPTRTVTLPCFPFCLADCLTKAIEMRAQYGTLNWYVQHDAAICCCAALEVMTCVRRCHVLCRQWQWPWLHYISAAHTFLSSRPSRDRRFRYPCSPNLRPVLPSNLLAELVACFALQSDTLIYIYIHWGRQ